VKPDNLVRLFAGMAQVACLTDVEASWSFAEELDSLELPRQLAVYNGAVRLFAPSVQRDDAIGRHPLYLPRRDMPAAQTENWVVGRLLPHIIGPVPTSNWFTLIERIDVRALAARSEALLQRQAPAPSPALEQENERLRGLLESLQTQINTQQQYLDFFSEQARDAEQKQYQAEQKASSIEQELIQRTLDGARNIKCNTVSEALVLASTLFGDRVKVLDSANRSAARCVYRDADLVFLVLSILVVAAGDRSIDIESTSKNILGKRARWRPRDSPETTKKFGKDRTFDGKLYTQHFTLGHGERTEACMQVYFDFDNTTVVVAYAGSHLPTVGKDT
jgi:hypothetical protein